MKTHKSNKPSAHLFLGASVVFYILGFLSIALWNDQSYLYFFPVAAGFSVFWILQRDGDTCSVNKGTDDPGSEHTANA